MLKLLVLAIVIILIIFGAVMYVSFKMDNRPMKEAEVEEKEKKKKHHWFWRFLRRTWWVWIGLIFFFIVVAVLGRVLGGDDNITVPTIPSTPTITAVPPPTAPPLSTVSIPPPSTSDSTTSTTVPSITTLPHRGGNVQRNHEYIWEGFRSVWKFMRTSLPGQYPPSPIDANLYVLAGYALFHLVHWLTKNDEDSSGIIPKLIAVLTFEVVILVVIGTLH